MVDDTSKAVSVLEQKLSVKNYKQVSANKIRVYEYLNDPAEINLQLSRHGLRVSSIALVDDSLEEYYMKAIGGNGK